MKKQIFFLIEPPKPEENSNEIPTEEVKTEE